MKKCHITFQLNGITREVLVNPNQTLLRMLREDMGLTGTKYGCGEGDCGACTILLDDEPVNSCLILAAQVDGHRITTIEGLADGDKLHPLQTSFIEHGAIQCGFCTPGMLLSAKALLDEQPEPSELEIRTAISGNLCRCTGYQKIVKAILKTENSACSCSAASENDCQGEDC
ncbi:MAG TPA: (2Fe-2S)-binding protein [Desulfarculaceae bacterium]|nr:(2Fe-2S)-binding protein [Desulfarculaceae bacterium]